MTVIETNTVGQLVAERPARARVFERFGIDYCCGGKRTLREAAAERGIDARDVIAALREADQQPSPAPESDWMRAPLSELIAHIVDTHHVYLRRELPRLSALTAKVHEVHGQRHPELAELHQTYEGLRSELESHMMKEEQILFPLINQMESIGSLGASHCGSVQNPIHVMEYEHDAAAVALTRMRELTHGFVAPEDGCNTYRAMLDGLAGLEADLHQHIHKENNILFPRAVTLEAALSQLEVAGRG